MPPSPSNNFWLLESETIYLNHGSFGSCPRPVLAQQEQFRQQMERNPMRFFVREFGPLRDAACQRLAHFVGADPDNIAFVSNATSGITAVLRALPLEADDELLCLNQSYPSNLNGLNFVARKSGARVVEVPLPFPLSDPAEVTAAFLAAVTPKTRLLLLDHITSSTALILPVAELIAAMRQRGIWTLIDGAHAPGMIPLALESLGADFYVGNCHKWLCAPKGVGFLYVAPHHHGRIEPLVISHGGIPSPGFATPWRQEFAWSGTRDYSPMLAIPATLDYMEQACPGGWPALMAHNHHLALTARQMLCQRLEVTPPAPESMIGSMAVVPLPHLPPWKPEQLGQEDPIQSWLHTHHRIEIPIGSLTTPPMRLFRLSAQIYNTMADYERLAEALSAGLPEWQNG